MTEWLLVFTILTSPAPTQWQYWYHMPSEAACVKAEAKAREWTADPNVQMRYFAICIEQVVK